MAESGKIIKLNKDKATVIMKRNEACGDCKACEKGENGVDMYIEAFNVCNGKIGDTVSIEMEIEKLIFATFVLYGVPMITLVLGFVIGNYFFHNDVYSFFTGILFLAVTYLIIKFSENFWKKDNYIPVAKKIL